MSPELTRAAWRNHSHGNAQFLRPAPRTAREAFGGSMEPAGQPVAGLILAAVLIGLALIVVAL